jgi:hypothetical protein
MLNSSKSRLIVSGCVVGVALAVAGPKIKATDVRAVFVIAMENHNWVQPLHKFDGNTQQIYQNPAAPYLNALVDGSAPISDQVAYAAAYHNVLATPSGSNPHIHPSEPNYVWAEAGTNFGINNDNDPYLPPPNGTVQNTTQHLTTLLTNAGHTWKSYQEDTDIQGKCPSLANVVLPESLWTVPISSCSGVFTSGVNQFYGTAQFNYAAKHNPMVFFRDTSGNGDPTAANPMRVQYAPLQQLFTDLSNDTVAEYNWITPNQYNDMHTTLSGGFGGLTADPAKILQGDAFLSQIIPVIMASDAYKNNGVIILWWDESEAVSGDATGDDFAHTLPFIVISKNAHKNVDGKPYASAVNMSHSSFLREMQEIFGVGPLLGDAANANDLSDLFKPGNLHETPRGK